MSDEIATLEFILSIHILGKRETGTRMMEWREGYAAGEPWCLCGHIGLSYVDLAELRRCRGRQLRKREWGEKGVAAKKETGLKSWLPLEVL